MFNRYANLSCLKRLAIGLYSQYHCQVNMNTFKILRATKLPTLPFVHTKWTLYIQFGTALTSTERLSEAEIAISSAALKRATKIMHLECLYWVGNS